MAGPLPASLLQLTSGSIYGRLRHRDGSGSGDYTILLNGQEAIAAVCEGQDRAHLDQG
jgi:hypothetical protein